jgi:flagellar hook-length control protein FliK
VKSTAKVPGKSTASSDPPQNAAATVDEADVSSIEGDLATQDGKPSAKSSGKAPSDVTESSSVATDQATLSLLLAASGLQVNGNTGGSQQNSQDNASADQDSEDQTASAIAASVAASVVAPAGLGLSAASAAGPQAADGQKPVNDTVAAAITAGPAGSAGSGRAAAPLDADALLSGNATGEFAAPDASLLQNKSSAPDSLQPLPTSVTGSNGLPEMMRGLSTVAAASSGVDRTISVPVSDRNWGGAVAGQLQWMVNSNVQSATLQLSPEHLGPVEVRIDVQSSQVNVSFTAAHPDTRSALEQSVPQLRAMLANGGLTLGQANVQQEARPNSHYSPGTARAASNAAQTVDSVAISPTRGLGLIDEYA